MNESIAEQVVTHPKVIKGVKFYATLVANNLPSCATVEDAEQELWAELLRRFTRSYDPERSGIHTFAIRVMRNFVSDTYRKRSQYLSTVPIESGAEIGDIYSQRVEEAATIRMGMELARSEIEDDKSPYTRKVYDLLCKGFSPADCSREFGITRSRVAYIISQKIKPHVAYYCE